MPTYESLAVGEPAAAADPSPVRRVDLVRYAGAAGDFNDIHWERTRRGGRGPANVIAHGMFTMAQAIRRRHRLDRRPGRGGRVRGAFHTKPVVVPDDGVGAQIEVSAKIGALLGDNRVARGPDRDQRRTEGARAARSPSCRFHGPAGTSTPSPLAPYTTLRLGGPAQALLHRGHRCESDRSRPPMSKGTVTICSSSAVAPTS